MADPSAQALKLESILLVNLVSQALLAADLRHRMSLRCHVTRKCGDNDHATSNVCKYLNFSQ